jgi:hypothetical protein
MTMLTEDEAKAKWCPLARTLDFDGHNASAPHNRVYRVDYNVVESDMPGCHCIASACMAWRKVDQTGIGPNGEKRDRDMDGRTRWVDRGFCGAFGKPS